MIRAMLLGVIIALIGTNAYAASKMDPADYTVMNEAYEGCKNSVRGDSYKCDCYALAYVDAAKALRTKLTRAGEHPDYIRQRLDLEKNALQAAAQKQCIDKDKVAAVNYGRCVNNAIVIRDDYREFCSCFALKYAQTYHLEGQPFTDPSAVMARAMIACNKQ